MIGEKQLQRARFTGREVERIYELTGESEVQRERESGKSDLDYVLKVGSETGYDAEMLRSSAKQVLAERSSQKSGIGRKMALAAGAVASIVALVSYAISPGDAQQEALRQFSGTQARTSSSVSTGNHFFHEVFNHDDYRVGQLGAMRFLIDESGAPYSEGFHRIAPNGQGGYNAELGACDFTLAPNGGVLKASSDRCLAGLSER